MSRTLLLCLVASGFAAAAEAQIAVEGFDTQNTHAWGVEFGTPAPWIGTGGNPGGAVRVSVQSSQSNLPVALVVPDVANHPWAGNFRSLGVGSFRFDREVTMGSSNFGTSPFLVLGNDGGTRTDFADDTLVFVATGDVFQFGASPWTTFSIVIPSASAFLPSGWDAGTFPASPNAGLSLDELWNVVIVDVSYVGIAMGRPLNGAGWFGAHVINFDNFALEGFAPIGTNYCGPSELNSAGLRGVIGATGRTTAAVNDVALSAESLPPNQFGIFVVSRMSGFVPAGPISNGNLCLGGMVGRFNLPSQILPTGGQGRFDLTLDLTLIPQGSTVATVQPGETWYFQAWHRDFGGSGSNFTDGIRIDFQ